ncbi:MAG: V-type ATP synthase subunit D [Methylovulum sp.]|nr:MAG: V-type ATP synthase subunit D [Methylovulum sp.]
MSKQSFSKAALHKEAAQLKRYRQFLPSLDLKRQQLVAERYKATAELAKIEEQIRQCRTIISENLPMISDYHIALNDLVIISEVSLDHENSVGVKLPVLKGIGITIKPYSSYAKPHWVDQTVIQLKRMLELKVRLRINQRRLDILDAAVKKVTQRVNFFDKILIPRAQQTIKKISIFISDAERAAVVRAKITKQKRLDKGASCP